MNANKLLTSLFTAVQQAAAYSDSGSLGSFNDVNNFLIFRQASGIPRGEPIDYDGFRTALQQLNVPTSDGMARLAFGIIVSMAEGNEDAIQFQHFRQFQEWASKRVDMQGTLNLTSTRIHDLESKRDAIQATVDQRAKQKKNRKTPRDRLQLTGRSTSRRPLSSRRATSARRSRPPTPKALSTKKSASHEMFEDKMMMKYRTLRAAFRAIDTDNDHAVDWSEVQRLLRNFNMDVNDPHLHQIFLDADSDGDGSISYQEFQGHFGELLQPTTTGGTGTHLQNKSGDDAGHGLQRALHGGAGASMGKSRGIEAATAAAAKSSAATAAESSGNLTLGGGRGGGGNDNARRGPTANSSQNVFNDKMRGKYKSLHAAFRWMDEDNDHRVSWEEIQRLLHNFNMDINDVTLHSLFLTADADDDGSIDFQEFKATFGELLMPSTTGGGHDDELRRRSAHQTKQNPPPSQQRLNKRSKQDSSSSLSIMQMSSNGNNGNNGNNGRGSPHKARNRSTGSHEIFHDKMRTKFGTIRKAFRWMDEDSDHKISWEEIQRLLLNFNMNSEDEELHQLFRQADADNSGVVDYQEFQKYFGELIQPSTQGYGHGGCMSGRRNSARRNSGSTRSVPKLSLQRVKSPTKKKRDEKTSTTTLKALSQKPSRMQQLKMSALISGPPSVFKTLQEKIFVALSSNR